MVSSELEEQHESLRRAVDSWRCRGPEILKELRGGPCSSAAAAAAAADSRGASSRPIEIHVEPMEHSGLRSLLDSDNVDLAKFVMVLSYDCIEIARLRRHASRRIYRQLLLFGHRSSSQEVLLEGEPQKAVGQSLSLFMELYETVSRMSAVLNNLLRQLNYLYSQQDKNSRPYIALSSISLRSLFDSFGEGMSTLLVLDEILRQNTQIKGHLSQFKRMLSKVKLEIDTFNISVKDLDSLDEVVSHVENLFNAGLFQCMINGGLHSNDVLKKTSCNRKLIDAFTSWTHNELLELLPRLDTWKEHPVHRMRILQHIAVFIFYAHALDEAPEKKLGKIIADMLRKVPVIYVECGIRFTLLGVIKRHCPQLLTTWPSLRGAAKDGDLTLKNYLTNLSESHSRDCQAVKDSLSCWVASFQSTVHPTGGSSTSHADFQLQLRQIIQGILLASRMHTLALSIIDLHSSLEVPVRREKFRSLCHMLILMKVIAKTFCAKRLEIIQCLPHVINLIQANIEGLILPAKLHLEAAKGSQMSKIKILSLLTHGGKDADAKVADSLSLVLLSIHLLQGNGSSKRQKIFSITMDVLESIGHVDVNFVRIRKLMSKLAMVVDFQSIVEEVTDCSFLYWRKEMLRDWLNMVYIDNKFSWLQYLLDAFCDGLRLLDLGNVGKLSQQSYKRLLEDDVTNEIVLPLCRDIENDLRLHVHSTYLKGSVHVNLTKSGVRNLSWYLQMRPLCLPFKFIDIRILVESYLNSTFYNHTTMALYNWKVYSEMRQLAELKYGLLLDDTHLPGDSSGHGFDFAETIKDVCTFARSYTYNLIKQIFIAKVSNGQQRKTPIVLGVDHVVSAISTHGLTTIGTAIESIIAFLTQKMQTLSDLLQDDILRSLILKEKIWKGEKGIPNKYPFTRAEQLSAAMVKHSFGDHEISVIEQLHSTITEIGNGLGLARLLHTGGSRHACQTSSLTPTPRTGTSYMESGPPFISPEGSSDKAMDGAADDNHVSLLLSSVSKELQRSGSLHLEDFHLLVPALTVSLMEMRLLHREKSLRRDRELGSHLVPDDGFPMGACCILKVTEREKSFDELNWFASASKHLDEALASLGHGTEQPKASRIFGLKLWNQATPPISISPESHKGMDRLRRCQKEMALVEYSFNAARAIIS